MRPRLLAGFALLAAAAVLVVLLALSVRFDPGGGTPGEGGTSTDFGRGPGIGLGDPCAPFTVRDGILLAAVVALGIGAMYAFGRWPRLRVLSVVVVIGAGLVAAWLLLPFLCELLRKLPNPCDPFTARDGVTLALAGVVAAGAGYAAYRQPRFRPAWLTLAFAAVFVALWTLLPFVCEALQDQEPREQRQIEIDFELCQPFTTQMAIQLILLALAAVGLGIAAVLDKPRRLLWVALLILVILIAGWVALPLLCPSGGGGGGGGSGSGSSGSDDGTTPTPPPVPFVWLLVALLVLAALIALAVGLARMTRAPGAPKRGGAAAAVGVAGSTVPAWSAETPAGAVIQAYVAALGALARAGEVRRPQETAREFAARVPQPALAELTTLYELARHGPESVPDAVAERARSLADEVARVTGGDANG